MDPIPHTRVLVVDDDQDSADLIAETLRDRGIDARVALDGRSALDLNREFTAEVALLDLGLPDMDGHELARRLKLVPSSRDIRLVALTGYSDPEARERVQASGFDEHLVKPVRFDELESVIERLGAASRAAASQP